MSRQRKSSSVIKAHPCSAGLEVSVDIYYKTYKTFIWFVLFLWFERFLFHLMMAAKLCSTFVMSVGTLD